MEHSGQILLELFLMFAGGKLLAEMFEWLRQPGVLGELLAGVLLGPSLLNLVHTNEFTLGMAEIGAVFLLFTVGLETKPRDLLEVGWTAVAVGVLGVAVPFVLGLLYMEFAGHTTVESIFVGAAMVATSVGITARVLGDLGALSTRAARVILAAAVLDDILGLLVLAVVSSLSTGQIHYAQLLTVAAEAVVFSLLMIFFGSRVIGRFQPHVEKLRARNSAFILSIVLCLGLSVASVHIGMAAIVGAFLSGLALADHSERWKLHENAHPLGEFLAPFFFVILGVQVNVRTFANPSLIGMASIVCVLAIVGKLFGCGLGSLRLGFKDALRVGVGMIPRGEVGLIVAGVGLTLHTISDAVYSIVLVMSIVTTLVAPPFLRMVMPLPSAADPSPAEGVSEDESRSAKVSLEE
ncbi:MAG TPA: cation:proton antiporter [Terriglobia bacterium]|nr:cation:proton antiporter [Terriglobia bacterium]